MHDGSRNVTNLSEPSRVERRRIPVLLRASGFVLSLLLLSSSAWADGSVYDSNSSNVSIPDNGGWVSSTMTISGAPAGATVTSIDVFFRAVHPYSGDLNIDLNADDQGNLGNFDIWSREGGSSDNPERTVEDITTFNGLSVNRTWYLYARDEAAGDSGYIDRWWIRIYYEGGGDPPGSFTLSNDPPVCDTDPPGPSPAVHLDWTSSSGATSYDLYRNGSLYWQNVGATEFYNSANLNAGQTYTYFIRARNSAGTRDSNSITVTIPSSICASTPGPFTLSNEPPVCDTDPPGPSPAVQLDWTSSSGATSYDLYRNGSLYWQNVGATDFYNSANLTAGQTYVYFVRARNSAGSEDSNSVSVSIPANICSSGAPPDIRISPESLGFAPGSPSGGDVGGVSFGSLYRLGDDHKAAYARFPAAIESREIEIDLDLLRAAPAALSIQLPSGSSLEVRRDFVEQRRNGGLLWTGRAEGRRIVLTVQLDVVVGRLETPEGVFEIMPAGSSHVLLQRDSKATLSCDAEWVSAIPKASARAARSSDSAGRIDVMAVYTAQARDGAGGDSEMRTLIQSAVDVANMAFRDSGMDARLFLVHAAPVSYTESGSARTDLEWLATNPEVADLRDRYGADMVALFAEYFEMNSAGRGYVMRTPSADFESSAFQVTRRSAAVGNLTYAHEHGHNMGFEHNPEDAGTDPPSYPWSFGHYVDDDFRTVMSYADPCSDCMRVGRFSNPSLEYDGRPTGILNERDNHRTGNLTAGIVANFRIQNERQVEIHNDGGSTLVVSSIAADSWLSTTPGLPLEIGPGSSATLTLTADLASIPSEVTTSTVLVYSNDPDENPYPDGIEITVLRPAGDDAEVLFEDGFESGDTAAWSAH